MVPRSRLVYGGHVWDGQYPENDGKSGPNAQSQPGKRELLQFGLADSIAVAAVS